jgi:predicted trehalose synthase
MPFGGLVVNRVHPLDGGPPEADVEALTAALGGDAKLAGKVARAYAEERALAERDEAAIEHLRVETGERDPIVIPQLDGDVHDVDGLVAIHGHLFAD